MSKTYCTIKIVHRDYTRKDNTKNVFLRLTINRKHKYFRLNVFVNPDHFKSGFISRSDPDHDDKNNLIEHYRLKAQGIIHNFRITDKIITFDRFSQEFESGLINKDSFYEFVQDQIKLLDGKLTNGTLKNYKDQINKMKSFKPDLYFSEIDLRLIYRYEQYLINERENNKNTVVKSLIFIKQILNKAVAQNILNENPIQDYKLKRIVGERAFLSAEELGKLEELYSKNILKKNRSNVLRYFLFSCYTGLRYQDIKKLRFKDITEGNYISIQMGKTKEYVNIPLINKAQNLIPGKGFDNQTVFRVLTDQPTNRYLKDIIKEVKIKKKISFHCARHTFATLSKSLGIDYDVISKILGHTDIKTTKIYTKYEREYLSSEMNKWN
jgi:site-specific recombinase XerD